MKKLLCVFIAMIFTVALSSCQSAKKKEQAEWDKAAEITQKAMDDVLGSLPQAKEDSNDKAADSPKLSNDIFVSQYDGTYKLIGDNSKSDFVIANGEVVGDRGSNSYSEYRIEQDKLYCDWKGMQPELIVYTFINDSIINYEKGEEYVKTGGKSVWAHELDGINADINLPVEINNQPVVRYSSSYFVISSDGEYSYRYYNSGNYKDVTITGVKSISSIYDDTIFLLKTNNELWGYGKNGDGILGDGTGVDRKEPVKILDDVSVIYAPSYGGYKEYVYAITNDAVLWRWGNGIYAPEKLLDDIAAKKGDNLFLTQRGELIASGEGFFRGISISKPTVILKNVADAGGNDRDCMYVLYQDGTLELFPEYIFSSGKWNNSRAYQSFVLDAPEKIKKVCAYAYYIAQGNNVVVLDNGECWGIGLNDRGQLGDSTKINRNEFVKIMDDILDYKNLSNGKYALIQTNGDLWTWRDGSPTPAWAMANIISITQHGDFLSNDGQLFEWDYRDRFNMVANNIHVENTMVNIETANSLLLDKLVGKWEGTYQSLMNNKPVLHGLTLSVNNDNGRYYAVFDYYPVDDNKNARSGVFLANVTYNPQTSRYMIIGYEWQELPSNGFGWDFADLTGDLDGDIFTGEVSFTNYPSTLPLDFRLERR